jgi:calcineurin-like phosphoesterase family protein
MTVWLISDTHFGEQPARRCKASGLSADELDMLIQHNWRTRVAPDDTVWHLGDVGRTWQVLKNLPGTKHLILAHASDRRPAIARAQVFASIQEHATLPTLAGPRFLVHNPDPWAADPRTDIVHGHHHYHPSAPGRRSVCVDHNGWGPVALEEEVVSPVGAV